MTDRELLQMALDALENAHANEPIWKTPIKEAIEALRARLAQPEPEPVATQYKYIDAHGKDYWTSEPWEGKKVEAVRYLYATPQPEPVIQARKEGDLIVVDLPQVPRGSGGITKDEQPEPKPYGYIVRRNWKTPTFIEADNVEDAGLPYNNPNYEPVFKAPPQRDWQGLTEAERIDIIDEEITAQSTEHFALAQAIEAKLKEKNDG